MRSSSALSRGSCDMHYVLKRRLCSYVESGLLVEQGLGVRPDIQLSVTEKLAQRRVTAQVVRSGQNQDQF